MRWCALCRSSPNLLTGPQRDLVFRGSGGIRTSDDFMRALPAHRPGGYVGNAGRQRPDAVPCEPWTAALALGGDARISDGLVGRCRRASSRTLSKRARRGSRRHRARWLGFRPEPYATHVRSCIPNNGELRGRCRRCGDMRREASQHERQQPSDREPMSLLPSSKTLARAAWIMPSSAFRHVAGTARRPSGGWCLARARLYVVHGHGT